MTLRCLYDVPAPAKLNLFLHVVGRRADGYHLIESTFQLIDWADRLHLERREDGLLQRHDLGPALPADDLCLRAARLLQTESGVALGADLHVDKQLPWGAGLGGGSSDAASTLLALNRLWGLNWPRSRLLALGARLGADVPFFIGGRNAFVRGVGDRLSPVELAVQQYAVLKPAVSLATREIFEHPRLKRDSESVILVGSLAEDPEASVHGAAVDRIFGAGFGRNDLQPPAEDRAPEVAQAARWLERHFGNSRMTGSGSAVFARAGMADSPRATWPAAAMQPGWVGRMCSSLEVHPLVGWADD